MDNYEYNELLKSLKIKIDNIAKVINPSSIESRLSEIESLEQDPSFWSDIELASQIGKEKTKLNSMLSKFQNAQNALNDATELFDLANSENDLDTINSLFEDSENLEDLITNLEVSMMLSGEDDNKNAIVTGTGFFNGTNGTIIEHEFENTSFSVSVIPTANPNGTVGDIWCVKTNKTVTV